MSRGVDLRGLQTEGRNSNSNDIDKVSSAELCQIINNEDATVAKAVQKCIPIIADAIESLAARVSCGGRVIYVGAGTSGRLGVLDASEIPPTYSAPTDQFIALIAGGDNALRHAQEGAEDDVEAAVRDLKALKMDGELDSLIGIAASGRTPYVLSCLSYAKSLGCNTIGVACSFPSAMSNCNFIDHMISAVSGPEAVTGSTRMKAGTATKLVLNMLSTGTMIKVGKTFGNMMIDLRATNLKLQQRSRNILRGICGSQCPESDLELDDLLRRCEGSVKLAVATLNLQSNVEEARQRLDAAGGILVHVLDETRQGSEERRLNGNLEKEYILCVDGGGSKCAAVLMDREGEHWQGGGGPCNVTDVGVDAALSSISSAIQQAVDACPELHGRCFKAVAFSQIWIGLAGYDREPISKLVDETMERIFQRRIGETLAVTNDLELIASVAGAQHHANLVTVLIAGTGSIAMNYQRKANRFVKTGRAGGWGHLLGDDGSGFDIGRQGIRLALSSIDEDNLRRRSLQNPEKFDLLIQQILEHFAPKGKRGEQFDLLTSIVSPAPGKAKSDLDVKKRIAGAARLIVDASTGDERARMIVVDAVQSLVRTLQHLHIGPDHNSSKSVLVLLGGLMQNDIFQDILKSMISSFGMNFAAVEIVAQPALLGAKYLAKV